MFARLNWYKEDARVVGLKGAFKESYIADEASKGFQRWQVEVAIQTKGEKSWSQGI